MARSSLLDPIDKFRFIVVGFREPEINNLADEAKAKALPIFLRGGFSEMTPPSTSTTMIEYKENTDYNIMKIPGITRFQPIELRRGMTYYTDLYNWFRQIHDPEASVMSTILKRSDEIPLADDNLFRRTLLVFALGRKPTSADATQEALKRSAIKAASGGVGGFTSIDSGVATAIKTAATFLATELSQYRTLVEKIWIINNAWPIEYKSGDLLSATSDNEKLIESVTLEYESFVEVL